MSYRRHARNRRHTEVPSLEEVCREGDHQDLAALALELRAQEEDFRQHSRQGPVLPSELLRLADAQAAVQAARHSLESFGTLSLLVLDGR